MKPAIAPVDHLPDIDDLDRAIVNLAARINAANYELLVLIRRFDERAGWLKWGFLNCADWLHWRCDLSMGAAREKVRVAHALKALPAISASFQLDRWMFKRPDGIAVPSCGYRPEDTLDDDIEFTEEINCVHDSAESYLSEWKNSVELPIPPPRLMDFSKSAIRVSARGKSRTTGNGKEQTITCLIFLVRHLVCRNP